MRQRGNSPQRSQRRSCPLPVQGLRPPSAVRAGRCGQSGAVRAGRGPIGRAQFPAQHRPRDGRGADDDCQAAKKKRRLPRYPAGITATAGVLPTSGKPMPRYCLAGSTGPVPRARTRPPSSKPSIAPCASAAACSCASPAPSANPWPYTRPELK